MRKLSPFLSVMLGVLVAIGLSGCNSAAPAGGDEHAHSEDDGHDHGDEHAHPTEGPHHGALIELGNEEYHGELVHNEETGKVTVYLLDSAGKTPVAIASPDITINLKHGGEASQFKLAAVGASDGKASEFSSDEPAMAEALDAEGAEGQLVVTINDKQFRGSIAHDHDHDDAHGHDH
ncbi:hypothetical protein GC197_02685 [bacterium]|nr:hypothetical protein [bacterium]